MTVTSKRPVKFHCRVIISRRIRSYRSCLFCVHFLCQCLTRSSSERQLQLLCSVYEVIQQGDVPMSSMLQAIMERVLLPLASHCCTKALSDFYVANVSDITALLLSRFTKVCFLMLLQLGKYFKMQTLIAVVALWFYFIILWLSWISGIFSY